MFTLCRDSVRRQRRAEGGGRGTLGGIRKKTRCQGDRGRPKNDRLERRSREEREHWYQGDTGHRRSEAIQFKKEKGDTDTGERMRQRRPEGLPRGA